MLFIQVLVAQADATAVAGKDACILGAFTIPDHRKFIWHRDNSRELVVTWIRLVTFGTPVPGQFNPKTAVELAGATSVAVNTRFRRL